MQSFWDSFDWAGTLQKALLAVVILIVTWALARLVRWATGKLVNTVGFLRREGSDGRDGRSVGDSLGQIGSLVVWLFGLVAILQVFTLSEVLEPLQSTLAVVMSYLPNIIGAGLVFFIGFVIARIARQLTETALGAVDWGALGRRVNPSHAAEAVGAGREATAPTAAGSSAGESTGRDGVGTRPIISVVGNLVFAVILIVVSISALQILGISAISDPAQQMLQIVLDAIPAIIAAALVLGIGYFIAKFVGDLLESTLRGLGTDRAVASMGITTEGASASTILTRIAQVAIMLFFGIMATRMLNFPEITNILNEVLELGGRVLFGGALIAAGFLIANVIARVVGPGTAGTIIRYTTIVLFIAMGLQYMGIADSIINLAFGALVVGGALAAALAYGLGGRDAAARSLQKMERKLETSSATNPRTPTSAD